MTEPADFFESLGVVKAIGPTGPAPNRPNRMDSWYKWIDWFVHRGFRVSLPGNGSVSLFLAMSADGHESYSAHFHGASLTPDNARTLAQNLMDAADKADKERERFFRPVVLNGKD